MSSRRQWHLLWMIDRACIPSHLTDSWVTNGLLVVWQMSDLNESPVLLLLDVTPRPNARELPVRLFESGAAHCPESTLADSSQSLHDVFQCQC